MAASERHARVRLRPDARWQAVDPATQPRLAAWFARGWPAVLARCQGDEPAGHWRLGVPLPPAEGKRRLALTVAPAGVAGWQDPLPLGEVLTAAPPDWQPALRDLQAGAAALGLTPGVYGAFAWQAITGLAYVLPTSDLDLLWRPHNLDQAQALFDLLRTWEAASGRRADGELHLPGGAGVCWRELAGEAARVLVKSAAGVALRGRHEVLADITTTRRTA